MMYRITTLLFFLLFSAHSAARDIEQGTIEIGGDLNFALSNSEINLNGKTSSETDSFDLESTTAYYFADNVALGVEIFYGNEEVKTQDSSEDTTSFGFGPALLLNFSLNEDVSLLISGSFVLADFEFSDAADADGYGFSASAGIRYFISDHVALNSGVEFSKIDMEQDLTGTDFELTGLTAGLGLSVLIK